MAVTLRFQSTGSIPGAGHPVTMNGNSLTIGRADENDLVLPDPDRTLSKRHCVIEDHNGNVVVVDISSNGTFLNYGKIALGATATPLNSGDILTIGPYEILVDIAQPQDTRNIIPDALEEEQVSHGRASAAPSASELLDAPGDGGDFLDDLLSGREGPVGPRGVQREEPDEDGLLAPLGPDDPLLPPAGEEDYTGPTQSYHSPSAQDQFLAPGSGGVVSGGGVIPDDWDDDFLAPTAPQAPEPAPPYSPAAPAAPPATAPVPGSSDDPFGEDGDSQPPIASAPSSAVPDDFGLGPDPEPPATSTGFAHEVPEHPSGSVPLGDVPPPASPAPEEMRPGPDGAGAAAAAGSRDDDGDTVMPPPPQALESVTGPPADAADPAPPPAAAPSPSPAPSGGVVVAASASGDDAASRAFLRSLGAEDVRIDGPDLVPTMSRLGHVMRIVVEGIREVLMTRTSIKSEFRIQQTVISAGGNNPLKFSISPEQAIEAMVKPSSKGYLDAADAADQALKDIKAHEVAMVSGMEAALKGVLRRLDPAELEGKIEAGGGLGGMLKSKKARYWEVYEKMYADISDQAENEFHELFAKEFARAYQEQLDKLK